MGLSLRRKKSDGTAELRAVLGQFEVQTFPAAVVKTLEVLRASDSSSADVAAAMSIDPGLTVRLLKLVNSAAFSLSREVTSVDQAVALAGFGPVESMVLSVGVSSAIPDAPSEEFDTRRFWWAASRRAVVARAFAMELHPATASLSFTAGLLQDMAVPMLAAARPDYGPVLAEWRNSGEDLHAIEQQAFGWDHCQVAEWLCAQWALPIPLSAAISGHHTVGDEETPPAVQLAAPFREGEDPDVLERVITRACEEFGLDPDHVVNLLLEAEAEAGGVAAMFI